jgi:hypothetical protein
LKNEEKVRVVEFIVCNNKHRIPHRAHCHPVHSEKEQVTPIMQQGKVPKTKMRGKMRSKQHSPEIVKVEFIPMETLLKDSLQAKKNRKRKGTQGPGMPSKPNRKTKITNQLRLNSKALFNPSLKDPQPL